MEKVRSTLTEVLGEKAAEDFIKTCIEVEDTKVIKRRVSTLLDTRKLENRQVYEILIREKIRRNGFTGEGYRKSSCNSSDPSTSLKKELISQCVTKKKKQKTKFYPLFCEGAQSDQLVSLLPGRHPCQCLATKHQLINNCVNCGRIVCSQEGSGPCYYCGSLVCTKEEQDQITLGTKQSEKLRNKLLQAPWASGTETPFYKLVRRAQKSSIQESSTKATSNEFDFHDMLENDTSDEDLVSKPVFGAQMRFEQGLINALSNRDKLLEFDATSAKRTRVIDDELDYFATEGGVGSAAWLSPEVREKVTQRVMELRAQRHGHRLQSARMCIDLEKGSVIEEDTKDEATGKLYNPNQEEMDEFFKSSAISNVNQSSGDRQKTVDSSVSEITLPTFIPQPINGNTANTDQTPVIMALNQSTSLLRIQDDESRQLVDEGYCLSLHQPWASLLVRGIKLEEGRTWYTPYRGCLWIASTARKADPNEIIEVENEYLMAGIPKSDLPTSYPTSCLLGRVNVINVITHEEYRDKQPNGPLRSPYVFICADPHETLIKFPIRGKHKIYKLQKHMHIAAKKNLT
ncbi:Activating signal cointegrator 1 [Schistosoma japonicum]|uniref:Activating signal cointegrator 1 n=3 Tax=Schistosoma japonicum TaxID=6182 RepID=A0A4Z2DG35_SCHJA|nr:Activating signal cointegrator 1 [Schistosoma japonicum]KAH8851390.1 Activating signal cointegrator 1 [Schistosoma japonicum]KAH8851393.1 Activating signal cointegrator 1 [Schistosoma japonicum]TNN15441.1 Activating signal cointegrator 1 [Schistosoma japonicum]TNN15442.1 Activating signal cointegrator 1 [Schistosoma japonicum]